MGAALAHAYAYSMQHDFCGRDTKAYVQLSMKVGCSYLSESEKDRYRLYHHHLRKCSRRLRHCNLGSHYWALAQEWELSIQTTKTVIWVFNQEWALAWDTTVNLNFQGNDLVCRNITTIRLHVQIGYQQKVCPQLVKEYGSLNSFLLHQWKSREFHNK